ncbi:MAG TPA: hypothetical protein PK765_05595 [bacterium]|nr:hypothetical protein [bacterium]
MNALPLDLEYSLTEQDFLRLPLPANNNGNLDLTPDTGSVSMGLLEEMKRRSAAAIAGDKSPAGFSIVHTTP